MSKGNIPDPGSTYLDHTGHFIPDADAASDALSALGFTVTPFSAQVQPDPDTGEPQLTGTGNICVMLPEGYLEFLVHTADTPIGREFAAALKRRAGLHLSAFSVADAAGHHAHSVSAGHPMRPLVRFSREVETETGTETARFTVSRLRAGTMPEGRVQVLTHHNESAMWQPRWTSHDNGAQRLQAIVISAPDPDETALRFERFLGVPPIAASIDGRSCLSIPLARGSVDILPEIEAQSLIGQSVEPGRSVFVALRIGVSNLAAFQGESSKPEHDPGSSILIPFHGALGRGAWLFEQI